MFFHGFVSPAVAWRSVQHGGGCQPEGKANLLFLSLPSPPFQFRVRRMREMAVCVLCRPVLLVEEGDKNCLFREKIIILSTPVKSSSITLQQLLILDAQLKSADKEEPISRPLFFPPPFFNQSPSPSSSFVLTALSLFPSTQWRKAPIQQSLINSPRRGGEQTPPPFSTIFLFREKSVPFPRKK